MDVGEQPTSKLVEIVKARLGDGENVIESEMIAGDGERASLRAEFAEAEAAVDELARRAGP